MFCIYYTYFQKSSEA